MNTTYEETLLSPTLTLRPVKWTDLEQVTQFIYDVCALAVNLKNRSRKP
jgi:hypothetical protein